MKKMKPRVHALKLAKEVRKRLTSALGQPVKVIMFGSQARRVSHFASFPYPDEVST